MIFAIGCSCRVTADAVSRWDYRFKNVVIAQGQYRPRERVAETLKK